MLTSYAQNFEDVILWRALKHVECGFYIDIGAQDPISDSVSLAFYERGWRGVHVEPTRVNAAMLRAMRPDEEVIEAAISSGRGTIPFFEILDTGMSTGRDVIAQTNERHGFKTSTIEVETLPLSDVLDRYHDRQIHWLKIDVEGMEDEVIGSWQTSPVRPWILCIESTLPNTQDADFASWEPHVIERGYEFVYFDGLNRFYVHRDHLDLRSSFGPGPNYFDDFSVGALTPFARKWADDIRSVSAEIGRLRRHIADMDKAYSAERVALNQRISTLEKSSQEKDAEIERLHRQIANTDSSFAAERMATSIRIVRAEQQEEHQLTVVEQLNRQLTSMQGSSLWWLKAPMQSGKLGARVVVDWPRTKARRGLEHALLWLRRRPRAAATVKRLLRYSPWLEQRSTAFSRSRPRQPPVGLGGWTLEPNKDNVNEWRKLLREQRTS